jgi:2',3'-cyclic-nucleotide 2'-phosphodiesterase (5'-nucleotidase family)
MTVGGLKKIGYSAVTFGPDDMRLSIGELVAATVAEDPQDSPFICANVAILDDSLTPKFRILKAGGKTIGVTAVLGDAERKKILSDEILHTPVEDALKALWPTLKAAKCDVYVLLAHASLEETTIIAQKFPVFDIVVTGGGAGEPTFQPEKIPHTKSLMVQVGTKGMYAGVIGIYDDPARPFRYQRVPLDDRFADSPAMLDMLASYQDQLREAGLEGLGLKPLPHPSGRTFVGSKACADCHSTAYAIWEKTPHAHATDSLVNPGERTEIPRHHDPECLSCHVTGWNAQKYFPYTTGYEDLERSLAMHGSGCENCHGPGSAHVAAENGDIDVTPEQRQKLIESMRLPLAEAERRCMDCHDHDNSPDFHVKGAFEKYWEKVKHEGKD